MLKNIKKRGVLAELIVVIAAIVVILLITSVIVYNLNIVSQIELCRFTVIAKSNMKTAGVELSPISLSCKTNFVEIKKDGIYTNEHKDISFKGEDSAEAKKEKIKHDIANEMHDCWYQFMEGKSNPWGTWAPGELSRCMICSEISFDSEFSKDISKIDHFGEFLNTEKPYKLSEQTYSEYFGGRIGEVNQYTEAGKEKIDDLYIDTSQPTYVIFQLRDIGHVIKGATIAGCFKGAKMELIKNLIGLEVIPPGMSTMSGCFIGFASSGLSYIIQGKKFDLETRILLIPANTDINSVCDSMQ